MNRDVLLAGILVLAAAALATTSLVRHYSQSRELVIAPAAAPLIVEEPVPVRPNVLPVTPATQPVRSREPQLRRGQVAIPSPRSPRRNRAAPSAPVSEPAAREALTRVGVDPNAEAIWVQAINDPNLNANQRRNLIEDLNETGFANPRNLTPNDLPLIESRIAIIEQIANDAMDDVNAAAFDEAYRDLVNMRNRVTQQ